MTKSGTHGGPKWNSRAIGICLYGDFRYCQPTQKQLTSAYTLWCNRLMEKYSIPLEKVRGHYDFRATACPAIDMDDFRKGLLTFINRGGKEDGF